MEPEGLKGMVINGGWVIQMRTQEDGDLSDFLALEKGSKPFQAALKTSISIKPVTFLPVSRLCLSVTQSVTMKGRPITVFSWGSHLSSLTHQLSPACNAPVPRHLQWMQPRKCLRRPSVWGWCDCQNAAYWSEWRHSCQAKGNEVQLAHSAILSFTRKSKPKTTANCSSAQEYKTWHFCWTSGSYYPRHMVTGWNNWNAERIFWFPV